jgi:signal transduction histidine kinase
VLVLAIVSLSVPLALRFGARVNAEVDSQANVEASLVEATAGHLLSPASAANRAELGVLVAAASTPIRGRVIVVDARGIVLADSSDPSTIGSDYATASRPEFAVALGGRRYQHERPSQTLASQHLASVLLVTAVPIKTGSRTIGAVRITQAVSTIHDAVRRTIIDVGLIGLVVLALGLGAGAFIAGQIARPLRRLERVARDIAAGDLRVRAAVEGSAEQRSLGESFNEMTDRIVRLADSQRHFVADASHQLRTPLTALRLRLDEARAAGVGADAAHELDAAEAEVDRFAQVIDELLVLSRAGERELPGQRIDLDDLAARMVERWRASADEREITLEHVAEGAGGEGWAAPADIERALDALVDNALRYAPRDSTVTLAVGATTIAVLDSGPGIAEDEAETVFERFHRGSAGRAGPAGTGLGLAIASELARGWGGEVTLENRPAGGAIATLRLAKPAP